MRSVWPVIVVGALVASPVSAAGEASGEMVWLKKMATASNQVNYVGTFVYQQRGKSETSRIVHYVNPAGGVFEKLETLDGPAREVIRTNDQVTCYLPTSKTVLIEQRDTRLLPAILPQDLAAITEAYQVKLGERDRVAGQECQNVQLEPRDNLRYGREFCVEIRSGLPLRVRTFNESREPVESFAFTEIKIGGGFNRDRVKSKYAALSRGWRVDRSALASNEQAVDTGWVVNNQPRGFRKLTEVRRSLAGRGGSVAQIVFSDGVAAISVFIEPLSRERPVQTLTHQGAVNIYTRTLADHMVTVLGEAPAATIMQIANSLELKPGAR